MSLRKILTNFPVGLQARKRPALICRSRKRGVHRSNAAASCLVKIAALRSSAACELAEFETASADGSLLAFAINTFFLSKRGALLSLQRETARFAFPVKAALRLCGAWLRG